MTDRLQASGLSVPATEAPPETVDVHAHFFGAGLQNWAERTGDQRWPALVVDDREAGRIMCGEQLFRRVAAPLWDLDARLALLDASGINRQVVSPVPVTMVYWADAAEATSFIREMNDALATEVARSGGRLLGLGAVPLQDVSAAIVELKRAVLELGLRGVEIGTTIAGLELDDAELLPFFGAAADLGAVVFVHPLDGGSGAIRRRGQPYDFGLGMLTDTAMAAGALVFGGVLAKYPTLRVALAHGCGTFVWSYPRLRLAAQAFLGTPPTEVDALASRLWVDALVFEPEHLRLLVERFGNEHVMLGTDDPFVPGQLRAAPEMIRTAVAEGVVTPQTARGIIGANALEWLNFR